MIEYSRLIYYLWCFKFGYECERCETHSKYLKWLKEDTVLHCGDCTGDPCPCERCVLHELEVEAQTILNSEARKGSWCKRDCFKDCNYKLK